MEILESNLLGKDLYIKLGSNEDDVKDVLNNCFKWWVREVKFPIFKSTLNPNAEPFYCEVIPKLSKSQRRRLKAKTNKKI